MEELKVILNKLNSLNIPIEDVKENQELLKYGFNSIDYIQFIVNIENNFEIEFNEEDLEFSKFPTLNHFERYINEKYQNK